MTEQVQDDNKKCNLQDKKQWIRIVYMVLFIMITWMTVMVTGALIFLQVLFALITGESNKNLRELGDGVTLYINQILSFLTYNDDRKPFPFAAWGEVEEVVIDVNEQADVIEGEVVEDNRDKSV